MLIHQKLISLEIIEIQRQQFSLKSQLNDLPNRKSHIPTEALFICVCLEK